MSLSSVASHTHFRTILSFLLIALALCCNQLAVQAQGGTNPFFGLIQASDGNFYGTIASGGPFNYGTVYKVGPSCPYAILHVFTGADGQNPYWLVQGQDGNLYGVAYKVNYDSIIYNIYKISPQESFTILHQFDSAYGYPQLLVAGSDGNMYDIAGDNKFFKMDSSGTVTTLQLMSSLLGLFHLS